jgi:alpha-acetolactate decarboxylase
MLPPYGFSWFSSGISGWKQVGESVIFGRQVSHRIMVQPFIINGEIRSTATTLTYLPRGKRSTLKFAANLAIVNNEKVSFLAEAASRQAVFQYRTISGTIVGFRTPGFVKGINLPGYHFHFISTDRMSGGHLLECRIDKADLSLDRALELRLALPENAAFARGNLGQDHGRELEKAER